eukprot:CAMPEP_0119335420 /NCGR_PEP_ID=MMETSP1333-20130426/89585_1 /TAXON_ID=418940 /ORGANISM="Scyphosphaera apsteinii, Strain RCC1455" /LENGTH=182 /DNA_ID=CAMNT_0007345969 /DNA_START=63 /DNA_END=608 /DNA_ORIENTATION=-
MKDRTTEFFAIADARCKLRGRTPASRARPTKTQFGSDASRVGRELHELEERNTRLSRLASKSSLFDDPAVEFGEISALVKHQLSTINFKIEALAAAPRSSGSQLASHSEVVLSWLRLGLANGSEHFQAALKQREAVLSARETRTANFSAAAAATLTPQRTMLINRRRQQQPHPMCGSAGSLP